MAEEILKNINDYVAEQRIETDLSKVRGYGIDNAGQSVSFRMSGLKELRTDIDSLELKAKGLQESVELNAKNITDLEGEVRRAGELPEENRANIERIDGTITTLRKRLTDDETKYDNAAAQIDEVVETANKALEASTDAQHKMEGVDGKIAEFEEILRNAPVQVTELNPETAIPGQIMQYVGDTTETADRGGFYWFDGSVFNRLKVDKPYKAGKHIEITEDGTINATYDHSPIEEEIKAVADDLAEFKTAQAEVDKAQDDATKANTDAIAILNGDEDTSGSVRNTVLDYIGKTQHARFKVVDALPPVSEAESNILYLVPFEGKEGVYKQYILSDGRFVQLDNTEVDLSDYYTKGEIDTMQTAQDEALISAVEALEAKDSAQDTAISDLATALENVYTKAEVDTAISDVSDALTAWNREQDTEIEKRLETSVFDTYKTEQAEKDRTQDGNIKALSDYLTEEKQSAINEAISKAHTQNTDSKLVNGVQSVEVTEQSIKLGHYVKDEENLALALGNGTSDNHHNAMAVDWNGNMKTSGNITDGEGNVLAKKATLTDLVVDGRVLVYSSANNGLISLTTEELRNLLMWVGTEAELDALPDSEIVEGRIYSTYDGTIKRR